MTLNQLYYFRTAAGQLNFHRTAEQLMISQPSLSAAIASLERELGVPLFLRKGRHLELSKYGLLYFKEVDALLGRLDSVNATLKRAARPGRPHRRGLHRPPLPQIHARDGAGLSPAARL